MSYTFHKSLQQINGCSVFCVGFFISYCYCLAVGLDEKSMKMGGLLVAIIAWALEQRAANKS